MVAQELKIGAVRLGHAIEHQSFLAALPRNASFLLTADAVYSLNHRHENALPDFMGLAVETMRSVKVLHALAEREGATVVTGHDADTWQSFKLAPAFYD